VSRDQESRGIVAEGIKRYFGDVRAVDGMDLSVARGQIFGFLGPLKTRSAAASQAATFAFSPLIFLSTTFVPKAYIASTWLRWVATINPSTYVFDAMRSLLNEGWYAKPLLVGLAFVLGFATLTGWLALNQARKATQLGD
jgi:ABC-type multidrug transport system permease subunit